MKGTNILKEVWPLLKLPLLRVVIILIGLSFVTKIFFNVVFTIIFINTVFDVLTDKELTFKKTVKRWKFTIIFFTCIFGIYYIGGFWGVMGLLISGVLVTALIVVYTLHINWGVYDAVTTWGAKRIKGETKEDFNLDKVMKDEQKRKRTINKRL